MEQKIKFVNIFKVQCRKTLDKTRDSLNYNGHTGNDKNKNHVIFKMIRKNNQYQEVFSF